VQITPGVICTFVSANIHFLYFKSLAFRPAGGWSCCNYQWEYVAAVQSVASACSVSCGRCIIYYTVSIIVPSLQSCRILGFPSIITFGAEKWVGYSGFQLSVTGFNSLSARLCFRVLFALCDWNILLETVLTYSSTV